MKGQLTGEWVFILFFISIFAVLGFLMLQPDYPESLKFMSLFDFAWFTGGIIAVSGACVVVSGIPCAIALSVWGVITVWNYIIVNTDWIKLLIFTPLVVCLIYIIAKLGRGGG